MNNFTWLKPLSLMVCALVAALFLQPALAQSLDYSALTMETSSLDLTALRNGPANDPLNSSGHLDLSLNDLHGLTVESTETSRADDSFDQFRNSMEKTIDNVPLLGSVFKLMRDSRGKEGFNFGLVGSKDKRKGDLFEKNFEKPGPGNRNLPGEYSGVRGLEESRGPEPTRALGASYDMKW